MPIECDPPLRWIAPNAIAGAGSRRARGASCFARASSRSGPRMRVVQDGAIALGRPHPPARARPLGAAAAGWTAAVDPAGGPVSVRVAHGRG